MHRDHVWSCWPQFLTHFLRLSRLSNASGDLPRQGRSSWLHAPNRAIYGQLRKRQHRCNRKMIHAAHIFPCINQHWMQRGPDMTLRDSKAIGTPRRFAVPRHWSMIIPNNFVCLRIPGTPPQGRALVQLHPCVRQGMCGTREPGDVRMQTATLMSCKSIHLVLCIQP